MLAAVWSLAILHSVILAVNLPQRAFHNDFSVFYSSAIAFRTGLDPYVTNLMPIGQRLGMRIGALLHDTDTPTALLFFMPFSLMRAAVSHTIWMILNGAALVAALILLIRPKYSGLSIRMAVAIGALALLYAPITDNFIFSQRQTLILLLLVLVMRSLEEDREAAAGLLLAIAAAYRAFPILVAGYFIVRRQWRPLFFMSAGLAFIGAITLAGVGIPVCLSYLHGMRFALTAFTSDPADVALRGTVIRLFSYVFGQNLGGFLEVFQRITITFAQVGILFLAAWPTYIRSHRKGLDERTYGLWVATAIVLSPLSWIHYMLLLLIPFVAIASAAEQERCSRRAIWTAIASYALIALTYGLREDMVSAIWWARGVRYLAEGSSLALLLGFLAAYWFATDTADSAEHPGLSQTTPSRLSDSSFAASRPSNSR